VACSENCAGLLARAERLRWLNGGFADVLRATLAALPDGALALQPLMARALQMGDELHNRNAAATSLLIRQLAPAAIAAVAGGAAGA
jgi:hypothetical protein